MTTWQPAWQVLVAFNNGPWDDPSNITTVASPPGSLGAVNVWTDITADVRTNVDTNRGRQHETDRVQSGTFTFTLDNRLGKYDSWNLSSPYTGKIAPGCPIRIQATISAVTTPIFTGIADVWASQWTAPNYGTVQVTAVDLFSYMNNALLVGCYQKAVSVDAPAAWWSLSDPVGSGSVLDQSGNSRTGTVKNTVTFGAAGAFPAESLTAASFAGTGYVMLPNVLSLFADITIECWFKSSSFNNQWIFSQDDAAGIGPALATNSGGQAVLYSIYNVAPCVGVATVIDGNWHHIVGVIAAGSGNLSLYVDGVLDNSSTPGLAASPGAQVSAIGYDAGRSTLQLTGTVAQVAVYGTAISAARILAHYNAGKAPVQELSGARVSRIAQKWLGLATVNADTGSSPIQAVTSTLAQTTALSYLQLVEQSEAGLLYMDVNGHLTFKSRTSVYTNTTSSMTFGDGGGSEIPFQLTPPQIATDTQDVYGTISIQRTNGNQQTVLASNVLGAKTLSISGLLNVSDSEILAMAQWFASQFAKAQPRIRLITVHPFSDPTGAATSALLGLDIGSVVTVNRHKMPGGGTAFSQVSNVEGINWHVYPDTGDFVVELQLTPLAPVRPWILGTSQLGTDTALFF